MADLSTMLPRQQKNEDSFMGGKRGWWVDASRREGTSSMAALSATLPFSWVRAAAVGRCFKRRGGGSQEHGCLECYGSETAGAV